MAVASVLNTPLPLILLPSPGSEQRVGERLPAKHVRCCRCRNGTGGYPRDAAGAIWNWTPP
jgi:hypothetical protein